MAARIAVDEGERTRAAVDVGAATSSTELPEDHVDSSLPPSEVAVAVDGDNDGVGDRVSSLSA